MEEEIKIKKWIIFPEFGTNAIPYIFDASKEDVNENELALCVQEQIYGKQRGKKK